MILLFLLISVSGVAHQNKQKQQNSEITRNNTKITVLLFMSGISGVISSVISVVISGVISGVMLAVISAVISGVAEITK